ncbi:MC152R [Molluscum contagiosum virus subtype 1]|uniref:3 beta-hydroxysteroid dehydrogenase/Delta 5-->4-isomerase n=3 Tax=Molluscum contagiosum virus TaxID=10279 RepID=Q98318_MCV1|nr:nucleotide-sugar epimerase [Molluscum contagiosum virus subtype 1]AAB49667.1 3-beta hydroxy-5-ene steroid dehydrogenase [Molluscum contagiosum virus]AAB58023.1 similar to variola A47L and vaccinia A44L [Molluscum contagiosum virus subtype 1]AAC55280.1 MC152R [Molluscum contagiosum virus subtype 1]AQY16903.1 MC152 [Molluscum contagiosum virus subtype 1]AQY17082.1 MC152 [Molluscum contagiosum virus subtype 1]
MKVYAVTGGGGFIGSYIVRALLQCERTLIELRVIDVRWGTKVSSRNVNVVYIYCDVCDTARLCAALEGVDVLIHTAGLVDVMGEYSEDEIYRANVHGTHSALSACVCAGVRFVVYTSSMEVVGPNMRAEPFVGDEKTEYESCHQHCYPRSKAEAEELVLSSNGRRVRGGQRMLTCALRPPGVYGEGNQLLLRLAKNYVRMGLHVPRTVCENALQSRVYVGNVAWMHVLAARALQEPDSRLPGNAYFCYDHSPCMDYEAFNVMLLRSFGVELGGPRLPRALLTVAAYTNAALQWLLRQLGIRFSPLLNPYTLAVANACFVIRTRKAREHMGYEPIHNWKQSRKNTTRWLRSQLAS